MFKRTRVRIFSLIIIVATVIITVMLSVIYVATTKASFERSVSLLESYMNSVHMPPGPVKEPPVNNDQGRAPQDGGFRRDFRRDDDRMFKLSTFYSVLYSYDGIPIKINCNDGEVYSEEDVRAMADVVLSKNKSRGKYGSMTYAIQHLGNDTLVAFIDNTMEEDNFNRLFYESLIVGFFTWCVVLILAWIFSGKIIKPLEDNDKKQKQFISDAGHELKTPISVISANVDLLNLESGDNKWLANIKYENERMAVLVKQLLELARAENMQQEKQRIDYSYLVSGEILPFESVAFEHGLTLESNIESDIFINGNATQLSQLVAILIDNAIEHSSLGKQIMVKLYSSKNTAYLSVVNRAEPISEDVKARLFERFYRVDEARSDEGHYGLGLAIAKAIVTAHGGKIDVDCYDGLVEFKVMLSKLSN